MDVTYRWIKVEGQWEPARELADGSYMPIGDIVPLAARDVKVGPILVPPTKSLGKGKGTRPSAPSDAAADPVQPDAPMNPA